MDKKFRLVLINKLSGFKGLNLIGSRSQDGVENLALFNSVIHVGSNPPLLGMLFRPLLVERHSYNNIQVSKHYSINAVTESILEAAHVCSGNFSAEESEFEASGLSPEYIDDFPAPFVAESPLKIGLSFVEEHKMESNGTIFMVGKIEKISLPDGSISQDGHINLDKLGIIAGNGIDTYARAENIRRFDKYNPGRDLKERPLDA